MTDNVPPSDAEDEPAREDGWPAIVFAGLLLLTGLVFFVQTLDIRSQAAIWPRGLSLALAALSAVQLARLLRRRLIAPMAAATGAAGGETPRGRDAARRAFTALWLLGYCLAARRIGFGPVMLVMLPLYMWVMGFRRPVAIGLITAGAAASMTYLFDVVAQVPVWEGGL